MDIKHVWRRLVLLLVLLALGTAAVQCGGTTPEPETVVETVVVKETVEVIV